MTAIRLHKQIDSETLHLPELKPFLGQCVEIIILQEEAAATAKTPDPYAALFALAGSLDIDWDAYREQREYDRLNRTPLV